MPAAQGEANPTGTTRSGSFTRAGQGPRTRTDARASISARGLSSAPRAVFHPEGDHFIQASTLALLAATQALAVAAGSAPGLLFSTITFCSSSSDRLKLSRIL